MLVVIIFVGYHYVKFIVSKATEEADMGILRKNLVNR